MANTRILFRTISPLRMKRIQVQEEASEVQNETANQRKDAPNGSEADRALTVVMKKLSKTLSVQATVNELIQQACDEKNLAVLYSGKWVYLTLSIVHVFSTG